ncbi:MAG: PD40 domain-containing protein [Methanomicrobia archaeon]|nr:PD40 domain-containing protein [Methanomicrobia archaeon]
MNEKFDLVIRFVNGFIIVIVILLILLPLVSAPDTATITNMGVKQLTPEPWDQKSFSWWQCVFSWSPDSTKVAYFSVENTFQEEEVLEDSTISRDVYNNLVLGVMNADGTGKIKCDEFSARGDRETGFLIGSDFSWSPDSKAIVYTRYGKPLEAPWEDDCDSASIWRMNTETSEKKELAQRAMNPSLSPDGKLIAYVFKETSNANRDIWIMNADGSNKKKLASNAGFDALSPSWSPDGTKIVYMGTVKYQWEKVSTWITEADGANNMQLASGAWFPRWNHDGTKIAYQSVDDKHDKKELWQGSVWIVNPDGTEKKPLITDSNTLSFMFSKWSPDSTKLTTITSVVENEVVVLNADGSGKYWPIPNNGYGSWSPDGKMIVYVSGSGDVHVINADGTQDKKLVSTRGTLETLLGVLWSPDGTKITYPVGEMSQVPRQSNVSVWVMTVGEIGDIPTLTPTPSGTLMSTPTVTPTHEEESPSSPPKERVPGFEALFVITGLLTAVYLIRRRKG